MLDGLLVCDHTPPVGSVALALRGCENCRRPFLKKPTSEQVFCNPCRLMYQEDGAQFWGCVTCGTERKYGDRRPEETTSRLLHCRHCAAVTWHDFSRMAPKTLD